ncbi:MAG: VPLPA-CTERM sorting domain-containing protein [Amphiplicatus sp.]
MNKPTALLIVVLAAIGLTVPANAAPVTWTLVNAVFEDGGTASGTFTYDADTNVYSAIDIVTTAGSIQNGAEYHIAAPMFVHAATRFGAVPVPSPGLTGLTIFSITWASALTNAGGLVSILTADHASAEGVCLNFNCSSFNGYLGGARLFVSGYVTTSEVPLPAALPMFLAGLAGMGALRLKKRAA